MNSNAHIYTVSFSSLAMTITTTIRYEHDDDADDGDIHDGVITSAEERINYELGLNYTDYCHSVDVDYVGPSLDEYDDPDGRRSSNLADEVLGDL